MSYPWLSVTGSSSAASKMLALKAERHAETGEFRVVLALNMRGPGLAKGSVSATTTEEMQAALERRWPGLLDQHEILRHICLLVPDVLEQAKDQVKARDEARRAATRALAQEMAGRAPTVAPDQVIVLTREDILR